MGSKSKRKGRKGEQDAINELTGWLGESFSLSRNLSQTAGGVSRFGTAEGQHDILGCGPFALEIKRYATARQAQVAVWWTQACSQCDGMRVPALMYRADQQGWRVVIPLSALWPEAGRWPDRDAIQWSVELSVEAFAAVLRESSQSLEVSHG